jgi:hypothetical protein
MKLRDFLAQIRDGDFYDFEKTNNDVTPTLNLNT